MRINEANLAIKSKKSYKTNEKFNNIDSKVKLTGQGSREV
jgi:hypothetical protein